MKAEPRGRTGKGSGCGSAAARKGLQGGIAGQRPGGRDSRNLGSLRAAALGWLLFTASLYAAGAAASFMEAAGVGRTVRLAVQALIVAGLVIPGACALYRRGFGHLPVGMKGNALKKEAAAAVAAAGAALLLAAAGFALAHGLGWLRFEGVNGSPALLAALAVNLITALLYEALPEELVFRALIPDALRSRLRPVWAFLLSLLLFVLAPVTVRLLQALTGLASDPITVDYVVLLLAFAAALQGARAAFGRLGASIGFHLAYLMLARFAVLAAPGEGLAAYADIEPGTGSLFVLFFMVVIGGAAAFAAVSAVRRKRPNSNA